MAKKQSNWPKYVLQYGTLAALVFFISGLAVKLFPKLEAADPEKYCPMGGLQAFVTFLTRDSLPCSMSTVQILMGLLLAAAVVVFGKLFCAFVCPVGTVEDLLTKLRNAIRINGCEVQENGIADKILRFPKYAVLFWVFYMTATASELFCKKLDPYYAVATGFKGEIVLWMSIVSLVLVILCGFFVKRFWCRYFCPLGAASTTFKFWVPMAGLVLVWWGINKLGLALPWWVLLAAWCLLGYILEITVGRSRLQPLAVVRSEALCGKTCHVCQKTCPYNIDAPQFRGRITSVDCTLCGECVAACPSHALKFGCEPKSKGDRTVWATLIPAIVVVALFAGAIKFGSKFELPTINVEWDITDSTRIETLKMEGMRSVKCFGSSMAFKARMEKVAGVHGVKTFVGSHTVVIKYDPTVTSEDVIRKACFTPTHFRVFSPDPKQLPELVVKTIRVEKMYDKLDLNYLGLQFRTTGVGIFGLESEYDCPVIVRVYMSPATADSLDAAWFKEVVNRKVLAMPVHGGGVKETPVDLEFVKMEPETSTIGISDYLFRMFDPFKAEFNGKYGGKVEKRVKHYEGRPQFYYEIADQNYEKPIIRRGLPFLSNHLSKEEGVIGMYLTLNEDLVPCIRVRYAAPMTADKIWKLMTMETWTITYSADRIEEVPAKLKFKKEGVVKPCK